jgi:hypothetical protein
MLHDFIDKIPVIFFQIQNKSSFVSNPKRFAIEVKSVINFAANIQNIFYIPHFM